MSSPTGHTRTLSSTHVQAITRAVPMHVQTADLGPELAAHQQQLTSIPADLPQLLVTTPTTAFSAQSSRSTPGSTTASFSSPPDVPDVPELPPAVHHPIVVISEPSSEPSPSPPRFASPGTVNPNLPVLPFITTPGSPPKPKPVQFIVPPKPAKVARAAPSPPNPGGKTWSPPAQPFPAGSVSTMSPVAAARTFNARRSARLDTPGSASAQVQGMMAHSANRPDRSVPDVVVGRETLFDLDSAGADGGGEDDARELPLDDLVGDALPEYIQVYLTPHPDRKDAEKHAVLGAAGDDKYDEKALDEKWDAEAHAVPAYRSTSSLSGKSTTSLPYRGPATITPLPLSIDVKSRGGEPKGRRCIPAKRSTRVLCIVLLLLIAVVVPAVTVGVVLATRKHGNSDLAAADVNVATADADKASAEIGQLTAVGTPLVFDPATPTVVVVDGPAATPRARRGLASVPPGGRAHAN